MPATAELVVPLTAVPLPAKLRLPFEPTFPPLELMLFGGFAGGFSVAELKPKVLAPPASVRAPQPVLVANAPYGNPPVGVWAISCCTRRRAPVWVTANDVTK